MLEVPTRPGTHSPEEHVCEELVRAREETAQLKQALHSRTVIGQATGVLMATSNLAPAEAFAELTRMSSHANRKLRDIAAEVVAAAGASRNDASEAQDSGRGPSCPTRSSCSRSWLLPQRSRTAGVRDDAARRSAARVVPALRDHPRDCWLPSYFPTVNVTSSGDRSTSSLPRYWTVTICSPFFL